MARSRPPELNQPFSKKRWRRRLLTRFLLVVTILVVTIVGIGLWVRRALPNVAVAEISRLTNTRVEMGAFDLHRDGSVSIDGLVVRPQDQKSYDDAILRARSVYARFSLGSIFLLSPRLTEIRLEDFICDLQFDLDTGQWNIKGLRFHRAGRGSGDMPAISILQGKLRYCKVAGGKTEVVMSVPIEARLGYGEGGHEGYGFEIKTSKLSGGYGESSLSGYWRPGELALAGGLSSTDIPSLERAWAVDVLAADLRYSRKGDYKLNLRVRDLHSKQSPEVDTFRMLVPDALRQSGPVATLQRFFARYQPSGTVGEINVQVEGNLNKPGESRLTGKVVCKDVSICYRNFPYPIHHLAGELDLTESRVVANAITGRHGDVNLVIEGWTKGYGDERQYQYRVTSDNMILDEDLYAALQPEHKQLWDAFEPTGLVGVDYGVTRTSPTEKRRYVSVDLRGVAAKYHKFPYPLEGLTGKLYLDNDSVIVSDVVSTAGQRRIDIGGKVTGRSAGKLVYYITVDANDIPLDATLAAALPPSYERLYQQYDVEGSADVRARVFTSGDANNVGPAGFFADVSLDLDSLRPKKLPLTLSDVSAAVSITPDSLNFKEFAGRYGQSPVTMAGGVQLGDDNAAQQVQVRVTAEEVTLDEKLMSLLPDSLEPRVARFHPEGKVNLTVDVKTVDANEPLGYTVAVECLGNRIEHPRFSYPLGDVRGTVRIDRGGVALQNIRARPEAAGADAQPSVWLDGRLNLAKEGLSDGALQVKARDIPFTPELGKALPAAFSGIYGDLAPQGPFDLDLETVTLSKVAPDDTRITFDGKARLKTCDLNLSGAGTQLDGVLALAGAYDTKGGFENARLALDAERLTIRGKSITDLRADIAFDPNTGRWSAANFFGDCHGGRILGNLQIDKVDEGVLQYMLHVGFNKVQLQEFLLAGRTDEAGEKQYSSGTMDASLSLGARIGDGSSRLGICWVNVVDMQVGKVSPLAKLLSVLRLTEPTDYTFEEMLIDSYLKRDKLLIEEFDMSGPNIVFGGSGTMDLPSGTVDLSLTARGRRIAAAEPTVLQSLTEGLGGAVVRVEVTGKADDPQVQTKALPVLEDSLKIIGTPR